MIVMPGLSCLGQIDSLFVLANKYYQQNEFDKAVNTYHLLIEKGIQSPEVFYNLGNAYYKRGELGYAILYYEKAKLLAPYDEDINQNLAIANVRVFDKIDVIPDFFIKRWIRFFINILPSNTWAIISLIAFALMILLFLLYFFSGTLFIKKISFYSAVILLFFTFLTYWSSVKRKKFITDNHTAVVVEPSVTVKSSPDKDGNNMFVLHEGTKVILIDHMGNWFEIRLTDGNKGWLEGESIRPV